KGLRNKRTIPRRYGHNGVTRRAAYLHAARRSHCLAVVEIFLEDITPAPSAGKTNIKKRKPQAGCLRFLDNRRPSQPPGLSTRFSFVFSFFICFFCMRLTARCGSE